MNEVALALIPLAAFWSSATTLQSAARLVNDLRDKVISGKADGSELSEQHRYVLLQDYRFVMVSSVLAAWVFAAAIAWAGYALAKDGTTGTSVILWAIAFVELLFGVFFIWCGVYDHGAMREWQASPEAKKASAALSILRRTVDVAPGK